MWCRILAKPSFWGIFGFVLHGMWFFTATAVLSDNDFGLHDRVTAWIQANRPDLGGPSYMHAFGYIGNAILTVFGFAIVCNVVALTLAIRQHRVEERIKRGLCPKCAYDLRGRAPSSKACPECGMSVEPTP
jgi:hypothetical protein